MAEQKAVFPGLWTGDQMMSLARGEKQLALNNILGNIMLITLQQATVREWPGYLAHAIRLLADDVPRPEPFLEELLAQVQALVAESSGSATQPTE